MFPFFSSHHHTLILKHVSMKRIKTLLFQSYQLFTQWYLSMKLKFNTLALKYLKSVGPSRVHVVITY